MTRLFATGLVARRDVNLPPNSFFDFASVAFVTRLSERSNLEIVDHLEGSLTTSYLGYNYISWTNDVDIDTDKGYNSDLEHTAMLRSKTPSSQGLRSSAAKQNAQEEHDRPLFRTYRPGQLASRADFCEWAVGFEVG